MILYEDHVPKTELHSAPEALLWYWIRERHNIYIRRMNGLSKPWTVDPILRDYRFTNPFRENDQGTVWLRENFLVPHWSDPLELIAFNICWYRMFNWTGTGERLGWQTNWDHENIKRILTCTLARKEKVFTSAHIVRSVFGMPKVDSIVDVCTDLWRVRHSIVDEARNSFSLRSVYYQLLTISYIGPFMAYEMVTDMRHTRILNDAVDIMTWANAGPGAMRGLQRLGLPFSPEEEATGSMRALLERSAIHLDGLPDFEMRDIEHSLCEFDKYCRVKFSEGRPRGRYPGAA